MAISARCALPFQDCVEETENKENLTPRGKMKTGLKLGSSVLSPFGTPGSKHKPAFKILSDKEIGINLKSASSGKKIKTVKRRSLATLQPSSNSKSTLVGQGRESLSIKEAFFKKKDIKNDNHNAGIIIKSSHAKEVDDIIEEGQNFDQTEAKDELVEDAIALMKATEKADDSYWKTIAEERRIALEETLAENENLYDEIDKLQENNEKLTKALSDAECFKILYNNILAQEKQEESVS